MKKTAIFSILLGLLIFLAVGVASAQEPEPPPGTPPGFPSGPPPEPPPPPPAPPPHRLWARPDLPWFMITFRPELGGGGGNMDMRYSAASGMPIYEEGGGIEGLGYGGLTTEAFFMPTWGRQFIISPMFSLGGGQGNFSNSGMVMHGQKLRFANWTLAIGLGYQWYFGAEQRTNFYIMGHLGGGRTAFSAYDNGKWQNSAAFGAGYIDGTLGSLHRFQNGFLLGGSLVFSGHDFSGPGWNGNVNKFWNADVAGSIGLTRLGLMLGYALK